MNWLPTNLEPVPSYLHAGGANIRKGNKHIKRAATQLFKRQSKNHAFFKIVELLL